MSHDVWRQDELEERIRLVEAADARTTPLDRGDYVRLLAACVLLPAIMLVIGWYL